MTGARRESERRIVAKQESAHFGAGNAIHSQEGARALGFESAVVNGSSVYGWAVPSIVDMLGARWLEDGWASIVLRRPTYMGDELTIRVSEAEDDAWQLSVQNQRDETCLAADIGLGTAPWLKDLVLPARIRPEPRPEQRAALTLENAPVGQDIRPMSVRAAEDVSLSFVRGTVDEDNPVWSGGSALVHPGWMFSRLTILLLHSFEIRASIAASLKVQHLAHFEAGQTVTVAGHFSRSYERNGHHYGVVDGLILGEGGLPLVRMQQATIFRIAPRPA